MDRYEAEAWALKHKLIVESINRCHDFDLEEINAEVARRLGPRPVVKKEPAVKPNRAAEAVLKVINHE